jgi:hypothetical protein
MTDPVDLDKLSLVAVFDLWTRRLDELSMIRSQRENAGKADNIASGAAPLALTYQTIKAELALIKASVEARLEELEKLSKAIR